MNKNSWQRLNSVFQPIAGLLCVLCLPFFAKDAVAVNDSNMSGFERYHYAAMKGDAEAQYKIGWDFAVGEGVEKDPQKAIYWLERAGEQGHLISLQILGVIYSSGYLVGEPNDVKFRYWMQKAADLGDREGQYNLGLMYAHGRGGPKDLKKAVYWYQKAAEQGSMYAQNNLGGAYLDGIGVEADAQKALYWYQKAAEQNYPDAQYNLGIMYGKPNGIPQDKEKARYWFQKAADQGDRGAQRALEKLDNM